MPQSKPLNPIFPIFLSPFSYNILKKDQDKGEEEVRGDPFKQDLGFSEHFIWELVTVRGKLTFTGKEERRQLDWDRQGGFQSCVRM